MSYCYAGEKVKRFSISSLLSSSQLTSSPNQEWQLHKYTGIQFKPPHLPLNVPLSNEVNPIYGVYTGGGYPGSIDLKDYRDGVSTEEPHSTVGGLLSLLSLYPGGLPGILSLSAGSSGGENVAEDRSDQAKDILWSALNDKKGVVTALTKDGIGIVLRSAKNLIKDSFSPVYYKHLVNYPGKSTMKRIIGHFLPQPVEVKFPAKYYYPKKYYIKSDSKNVPPPVPVELPVPGTAYGVPDEPVPVPTISPSEVHFFEQSTAHPQYESPVVVPPQELQTYPQSFPYPHELPGHPVFGVISRPAYVDPYQVSSYPYPAVDYYETSGPVLQPLKAGPVYKRSGDVDAGSITQNKLQKRDGSQ